MIRFLACIWSAYGDFFHESAGATDVNKKVKFNRATYYEGKCTDTYRVLSEMLKQDRVVSANVPIFLFRQKNVPEVASPFSSRSFCKN